MCAQPLSLAHVALPKDCTSCTETPIHHISAHPEAQLCLHLRERQGRANHPLGFISPCSEVRTYPKGGKTVPHGEPLEASHSPHLCLPREALLHCGASLQCTWKSRNLISAYMMAVLTSYSQFLVPGGVSCLSLSSLRARRRLQEEKQTRKQKAGKGTVEKWATIQQFPVACLPQPPATSAWLPFREELVDPEQKAGAPASGVVGGGALDTRGPCRGCAARQGSAGQGEPQGTCPARAIAHAKRVPTRSPHVVFLCHSNENNHK